MHVSPLGSSTAAEEDGPRSSSPFVVGRVRVVRRPDGRAVAGHADRRGAELLGARHQLRQDGAAVEREDLRGDGGQVAQQAGPVVGRPRAVPSSTDLRDEVLGEHGHGHAQQQGRHRDDEHAQRVVGGGLGEDDDVGAQGDRADRPQAGQTEPEPEGGLEERQHEQDEREGPRGRPAMATTPRTTTASAMVPAAASLTAADSGAGRAAGQDGDRSRMAAAPPASGSATHAPSPPSDGR